MKERGLPLPRLLAARLPFFYGWVVLACLCCAGFSRQGGATATFSIFVEPLTREFGWSRTAVSGAASLGGVLAALLSPAIGPMLDRHGSRVALCLAVLGTGIAALLLSLTQSLPVFYLLFCIARLNWASPFELGIYSALNNWFVTRRPLANSIATVAQMAGLVAMPLIAQLAMRGHDWRAGWVAIGISVLAVGFVPVWLLLVRRPEDLGLLPDNAAVAAAPRSGAAALFVEPAFSRRQAVATPAFWLLLSYTVLVYPVQAGVSLHQAANLIEHGVAPTGAAAIVSLFSLMSGVASAACGLMPRRRADPLCDGGWGHVHDPRLPGDDRDRLGRTGCARRRRVRARPRRHADPVADRLGRLFRAGQLRRHPRARLVRPGAGPGLRAAVVGRPARLDRRLSALARMLCNSVVSEHHRRLGSAPAAAGAGAMTAARGQVRRAAPAFSTSCTNAS